MKFSLYSKKNLFDEMQEQTMRRIEARGFWLLWAGLLLAILVQIVLRTPSSQWVGEFVVFMAGCCSGGISASWRPWIITTAASAPITAICAVGHARFTSAVRFFEPMTA